MTNLTTKEEKEEMYSRLQFEVMEDYLRCAEMAVKYIVRNKEAHMEEMRGHWDKLKAFLSQETDRAYLKALNDFEAGLRQERQTWLREEIVKLDKLKETGIRCRDREWECDSYNASIQTIIDRYQSELDQPISK